MQVKGEVLLSTQDAEDVRASAFPNMCARAKRKKRRKKRGGVFSTIECKCKRPIGKKGFMDIWAHPGAQSQDFMNMA